MTRFEEVGNNSRLLAHVQNLLNSYEKWVGVPLIPRSHDASDEARRLYEAEFVVVSHGTETDPVFNFGNLTAQRLWELDFSELIAMPSRYTAEPVHRDERARLLERTTQVGYVDDYSGIRISSSGKRFRIDQATIWNVIDSAGNRIGQAATFKEWFPLDPISN